MSKHRHKTVTHPQAACPETNVAHSEQPNIPIIPSIPKLWVSTQHIKSIASLTAHNLMSWAEQGLSPILQIKKCIADNWIILCCTGNE